jgi:hypothetical protein
VIGASPPLQTAVSSSLDDHAIAPEAALIAEGSLGISAIAANFVGMNVRATVDAEQERFSSSVIGKGYHRSGIWQFETPEGQRQSIGDETA